jgi:ubiquinone/menaquinone biosynthesis C-methylase UbiE
MSVWDDREFAAFWNNTYGLDMGHAPTRAGLFYPLLEERIWRQGSEAKMPLRLVDFGCGNGNLIRAFRNKPFAEWLGIDSGSAILETAQYLAEDKRIQFLKADISDEIPEIHRDQNFDHALSVFTLEEIPVGRTNTFFQNMAASVCKRKGEIHIVTQHPSYAFQQDLVSILSGQPNEKFQGHQGYFDTNRTSYCLSLMNAEKKFSQMANYFHRPMGKIVTELATAGLFLQDMLEIPAGVLSLDALASHTPKSGDVPRFLYLRAKYQPA